ncbi:MAG TPA: RICIN domain-containing protein [Acidobacteriota bacterium]|nr:RICIN domain-containing protein [Acidobacteriota bacterium]
MTSRWKAAAVRCTLGAAAAALLGAAPAAPFARAEAFSDCFALARPGSAGSDSAFAAASDSCWFTLRIHAVRVTDTCNGARPAPINPDQVARWIAKANEVYASARVRFEFDAAPNTMDWDVLANTDVNDLDAARPGDPAWERGKAAANDLASRFPRKVTIFFRHGPGSGPVGGGFSSTAYHFVVMPGFDVTTICGGAQNEFLLAHEVGHYFGLSHTFREFKTKAAAAEALRRGGNIPSLFDGDRLDETPPEAYIEEIACDGGALVVLNGIPFPFLSENVMSYYPGKKKTLAPAQARLVRAFVRNRFGDAMDGKGLLVPDARRAYQIVSLENAKSLEAERTAKEGAVAIVAGDWTGEPHQRWRLVPLVARDAGAFEIVSVGSGLCLTVENAAAGDGARLILGRWDGRENQKWRFLQDERGEIYIEANASRKVVGISGGAKAGSRGTDATRATDRRRSASPPRVEPSADTGAPSQRWKLLPLD